MNKTVCFIKRKKISSYNSIEELFGNIILEIRKSMNVEVTELKHFGASPSTLALNIFSLKTTSDIYHITGDAHYMAMALRNNTLLTIHDIQSALTGNRLKQLYVKILWFWLPAIFVKRITVISEFTKNELEKLIPFAKHKIRVVHNPVSQALLYSDFNFNIIKPHILLMGTKPNKNLERTINAVKGLSCTLIIIGKLTPPQLLLLEELEIDFENKFNLLFEDIISIYHDADLVCFASTYEGFGMPIVEAQSVGRPLITSNIGVMPEVAGGGAYYVNPFDVNSIRKGIMEVCSNDKMRERLINEGLENVKRFDIKQIAKDYMNIYQEMLQG